MAVNAAQQKGATTTRRKPAKRSATTKVANRALTTKSSKTAKTTKATGAKPAPRSSRPKAGGRFAAPSVRLGMTPPEVRDCTGQPECIIFGAEDHVEWQFGKKGVDAVGAPTLYVTTLTFAAGRVICITERMGETT